MNERSKTFLVFAAGVAAGAALPVVVPAVAEASRPIIKALLKHGMLGFERMRTGFARASESVEDLVAETRAEVSDTLNPASMADSESDPETARTEPAADAPAVRPVLKVMS